MGGKGGGGAGGRLPGFARRWDRSVAGERARQLTVRQQRRGPGGGSLRQRVSTFARGCSAAGGGGPSGPALPAPAGFCSARPVTVPAPRKQVPLPRGRGSPAGPPAPPQTRNEDSRGEGSWRGTRRGAGKRSRKRYLLSGQIKGANVRRRLRPDPTASALQGKTRRGLPPRQTRTTRSRSVL